MRSGAGHAAGLSSLVTDPVYGVDTSQSTNDPVTSHRESQRAPISTHQHPEGSPSNKQEAHAKQSSSQWAF
ncbi:hypothetical protein EYF80_044031 [Liparis tanakae]|uniref:Uncharacterized protein n=1 Tax=Liparis tanakae TaxID=230148 RepID=A0A4Z2FWT8_9TELE|nr:hypothetical protein EYF80_044031 [Liparis tanakae]